jgi:inorganic triphosphatase YgiF
MPIERELKFSVLDAYVPSLSELRAALAATPFAAVAAPVLELHDHYYDDPAGHLRQAGIALRRRRLGGTTLAGVKSAGSTDAALHERDELELPMSGAGPDAAWPDAILARLEGLVDPAALGPRVELDTTRVLFRLLRDGDEVAQLAFDAVSARAPGAERSAFFDEVEIEAGEGTTRADLELIAEAVDGVVKLTPNPVNKLERAAALLLLATW